MRPPVAFAVSTCVPMYKGMHRYSAPVLDERVRWALISGYLYGVRDALLTLNNNCSCNYQHSPRGYFL